MPLLIKPTNTVIRKTYGAMSTTDMFWYNINGLSTGRDVMDDAYFNTVKEGMFTCLTHGNGGLSNVYGISKDGQYLGGEGMGYDPFPGAPCNKYQGRLCKDYKTQAGDNVDFFWSHNELRKSMGADVYIIANITIAPIDDVYTQIEACQPQRLICIQFGEETLSDQFGSGLNYISKVKSWIDQIQARYETQRFHFYLDIPTIYGANKVQQQWINEVAQGMENYGLDKSIVGIRQYFHLFRYVDLTGDPVTDEPEIQRALDTVLPAWAQAIKDSPFKGYKVYVSQLSINDDFGTADKISGQFYLCSAYARFFAKFMEMKDSGVCKVVGVCIIGTNRFIGKNGDPNLDYQMLGIINRLWDNGNHYVRIDHDYGNKVDIFGLQTHEKRILVCIQNRSDLTLDLPAEYTIEGNHFVFPVLPPAKGLVCANETATDGTVVEVSNIPPYSILFYAF